MNIYQSKKIAFTFNETFNIVENFIVGKHRLKAQKLYLCKKLNYTWRIKIEKKSSPDLVAF